MVTEQKTEEKPQIMSKGWKRFWIVAAIVVAIVLIPYGLWRLAGGSFKPKPEAACTNADTRNQFVAAVRANPNDFKASYNYADYVYGCKEFDTAIQAYGQATRIADQLGSNVSPDDRFKARFGVGLAYLYNQNYPEAQSQLKTLSDENPNNPLVLYTYGTALRPSDPTKAIAAFQQAIKIDPNSSIAQQAQRALDELKNR